MSETPRKDSADEPTEPGPIVLEMAQGIQDDILSCRGCSKPDDSHSIVASRRGWLALADAVLSARPEAQPTVAPKGGDPHRSNIRPNEKFEGHAVTGAAHPQHAADGPEAQAAPKLTEEQIEDVVRYVIDRLLTTGEKAGPGMSNGMHNAILSLKDMALASLHAQAGVSGDETPRRIERHMNLDNLHDKAYQDSGNTRPAVAHRQAVIGGAAADAVMVPVEPTEEMIAAVLPPEHLKDEGLRSVPRSIYKAMLAAAPSGGHTAASEQEQPVDILDVPKFLRKSDD